MSALFRVTCSMIVLAVVSASGQQKPWENPDLLARDRGYMAAKVFSSVNLYFAHWPAMPLISYETSFKGYLDAALASGKRLDFVLAGLRFLTPLNNGQTVFTDRIVDQQHGQPLGFSFLHLDGKWVVTSSQVEGLAPGDVIAAVDNQPMEQFFYGKAMFIPAAGEREARTRLAAAPYLFPARFTLALEGGKRVEIDRSKHAAPAPAVTEGRWLAEGQVAYIRIPSFSPKAEQTAVELVKRHRLAGTLIVDVRGSAGDYNPQQLVATLMDRPYRGWLEFSAQHVGAFAARGDYSNSRFGSMQRYPGPPRADQIVFPSRLVILIDRLCRAGCEDFVMPFKDTRRGILVGETTMGSAGEQYVYDFRNGMQVKIGAKRLFLPEGGAFEGVGLAPDHEAPLRIEDLRKGRDPAMEKAQAIAKAS